MKPKLFLTFLLLALFLIIGSSKARAQTSCAPNGEACGSNSYCCSNYCDSTGMCAAPGSDSGSTTTTGISTNIGTQVENQNYFKSNLGTFITTGLRAALIVAAILCLMFIIWGALEWILSGGDKNKYESAQKRIMAALVGLIITAGAWLIWTLVINILGVNQTSLLDIQGSSGGSGTSLSCTTNISNCLPFADCQTWINAFSAAHDRCPTDSDIADFRASQEFYNNCGRAPTQSDWEYRYNHSGQWPSCN